MSDKNGSKANEVLKSGRLCTLVYEQTEQYTSLKRCIPNEGVFLFEISATYAKQVPPSKYYYLGTSMKNAKKRFTSYIPWMKITGAHLVQGEEAERILTNPKTNPNIMPM